VSCIGQASCRGKVAVTFGGIRTVRRFSVVAGHRATVRVKLSPRHRRGRLRVVVTLAGTSKAVAVRSGRVSAGRLLDVR
jgi:hypothetical protein